jgi:hypothetical protein
MLGSSGVRAGPAYELDPHGVVHWSGTLGGGPAPWAAPASASASTAAAPAAAKAAPPQSAAPFALGAAYCYPNPAKSSQKPTLHVEAGAADEVDVNVYSAAGGLVSQWTMSGGAQEIGGVLAFEQKWDDSKLGSGVYVLGITAKKSGFQDLKTQAKCAVLK